MHASLRQLARFCLSATITFGVSLLVLTGLTELLGVNYVFSYIVAFLSSNLTGFFLNANFTFAGTNARADRSAIGRYMCVNLMLLGFNTLVLRLLVEHLHLWYVGATILLAIGSTPLGFMAHRLISYRVGSAATINRPESLYNIGLEIPTQAADERQ